METLKKFLIPVMLSAVLFFSGCVQQSEQNQSLDKVTIKNFAFSPAVLTVQIGTTVTWVNEDSVPHTATSEGNFDSGIFNNGESFSFTFNNAGTFDYICTLHPYMKGKIIVGNNSS